MKLQFTVKTLFGIVSVDIVVFKFLSSCDLHVCVEFLLHASSAFPSLFLCLVVGGGVAVFVARQLGANGVCCTIYVGYLHSKQGLIITSLEMNMLALWTVIHLNYESALVSDEVLEPKVKSSLRELTWAI
jgi:hypothetical protein